MSETKPAIEKWALDAAEKIVLPVMCSPERLERAQQSRKERVESVARILSERFHDPEKVAKLIEAADLALSKDCMCHATDNPDWHSTRCPVPALRAALAGLKEGKNG